MSTESSRLPPSRLSARLRRIDPAVATAFACIVLLLFLGSLYSTNFLSPEYLLQQLKVGSFLGVIATGMFLVILLGQIDLSVPWLVSVGGMMAASATAYGLAGHILAIPFGIACGVLLGLLNGFGVAYLRIPSMIFTLGVNAVAQGLMVVHTGGFAPQDSASPAMHFIATGHVLFGIPNALIVWAIVGGAMVFVLSRTSYGRAVYAIGNRERAAYLSGINTRRVVLIAFAIAGGLSAFGGILLAGYASKAAQAMGDAYLLPSIAAVVLGGSSILGGRGSYIGTVAGVILITLLQSILSVMQMPEFGRQIIYGGRHRGDASALRARAAGPLRLSGASPAGPGPTLSRMSRVQGRRVRFGGRRGSGPVMRLTRFSPARRPSSRARLQHGGQRRIEHRRIFDAVEAGDGDVAGDGKTAVRAAP